MLYVNCKQHIQVKDFLLCKEELLSIAQLAKMQSFQDALTVRAVLNFNFRVYVDWALEATCTGLNGQNWNSHKQKMHLLDLFLRGINLMHCMKDLNWFSSILSEVLILRLFTSSKI